MLIRTRLILIGLLPLLLLLLFIAGAMVTQRQLDLLREEVVVADSLGKNIFALIIVEHDLVGSLSDRPRQQWSFTMQKIESQLPTARKIFSTSADESELFETLLEHVENSRRDFQELVQWLDQHQSQTLNTVQQDYRTRLSKRLHIELQSAMPIANQIAAINQEQAAAFAEKRSNAMIVALVFIAGMLLLILWPLIRAITRSVNHLKTGMNQVALGDLESRIAVTGQDEFAQLARHFNEMAAKLAEVTVARETLSAEVIERKRVEEELKLSAQLLNSTSDTVFLLDPDGKFVYLNEAAWKSRGYTRDEMLGMNLRELNAPEFNKFLAPRIKAVMENGQGFFESAHRCKDGTVMPVEINARVTELGGRKLLLSVIRDITERKLAEGVLRDSEERYRTMVESSNDMIWALAPDGRFTFINKQAADVTGRSIQDWLGKTFEPLVLEEDLPMVLEIHGKIMKGEKIHYEVRGKKADGGILTLSVNSSPIFTGGKVSGTISFASDITERKLAEEKLLKSEASMRAILDNAPYIAWLKDTAGRFIAVNEAFFKTTGHKQIQDVLGKTDLDLWPQELAEKYRADDAKVIATRQKMLTEEPAIMEDGKIHWVETFKTTIVDKNGQLLGTTGFARDITERKEYEEELKRSNVELEQFSYAISHDMRQPLRVISSYLQLLEIGLAGQLDSEKRNYFDFAIDGAKRIDQMLVALLEYSRVGKMGEPPTWIESRAVLDEALQFLQPAITEAQARLSIAGDWPRILASHDEILRLLQNLIGNAAKFRVAGRVPEITVTSEIVKNEWHLCVADNGVGIIPDQIKRLFQVFQRLQSRDAYEGTGIGLALCRKIVEHHKGRIWVESAGEGQGSKFCVVLPVPGEKK